MTPMEKLAVKIAFVLTVLIVAMLTGVWLERQVAERKIAKLKEEYATAQLEAIEVAVAAERQMQKEVNDALEKQSRQNRNIASNLARELDGMRKRAERAERMSEDSRAACAGADGRELSREDAGFLAREAARAEEQRAALEACYRFVDAVTAHTSNIE